MAPLPQYLSFQKSLFFHFFLLSAVIDCSLSVSPFSDAQNQLSQMPTTQIYLGRRSLLTKSLKEVEDDEDEETPPLPKKKKTPKPDKDEDDQALALLKKKKSSPSNKEVDDEEVSPKKKKSFSSSKDDEEKEVSSMKKKKSSISSTEEDEEVSLKKKKKSSSSSNDDEEASSKKKKSEKDANLIKPKTSSSKNQTKLLKPSSSSSKDQTKLIKSIGGSSSSKNKTKLIKTTSKDDDDSTSSSKSNSPNLTKPKLKKLNSTSNSIKSSTGTKSSDLIKSKSDSSAKNKTKSTKTNSEKSSTATSITAKKKEAPPSPASGMYSDDDIVSDFRDLPAKFQQAFIPDLHRISTTSKLYLTKANKEMTKGFKPYVGTKYAPSMATAISVAFILVPLLLVSLIFNKIKAYFSLQRLLIFIQIYLAIYFSILCLSSLFTGLEPLRFFYATSQSTYIWLQVLQTLGYVLYLLLLLMYLILVFSTESPLGQKFLGLAQTFVGFAVGLHYYMTVFHRVVLRQPPQTNWKVHGIYATCFVLICLFAQAERRKKAYLEEGGEEGKKS